MNQRALQFVVWAWVSIMMAACGGGGGDTPQPPTAAGPPEPRAESSQPLRLQEGTQTLAAQLPLIYVESLLALGKDVLQWVQTLPASPDVSNTAACELGGSRSMRWTDVDRNGVWGARDTAALSLADCGAPASQTVFRGTVQIELVERSPESMLARLTLGSGLVFSAGDVLFTWLGGFEVGTHSPDANRTDLFARTAPGHTLRLLSQVQGLQAVDRIDAFDILRSSDLDRRVNTSVATMSLVSDLLGGSLGLSTPVAASAYFDTFPAAARFEVRGADALAVIGGAGEDRAQIQILSGATAGQSSDTMWTAMVPGLLWVAPGAALPNAYAAVRPLADVAFAFIGGPRASIFPQARKVEWMFTRELNMPSLAATLMRVESGAPSGWGTPNVTARVAISGARVTLSWDEPLEPGRSYQVVWRDASGNVVPYLLSQDGLMLWGQDAHVDVAETVRASVQRIGPPFLVPGRPIELDATASSGDVGGGLTYRWRQVGGTVSVSFSSATQARTSVQVAALPGTSAEDIAVEVEVTDPLGGIDRASTPITLVPSPAESTYARLHGEQGSRLLSAQDIAGTAVWAAWRPGNPTPLLTMPALGYLHLFTLPVGMPLQPGTYEALVTPPERTAGASMDVWSPSGPTCGSPVGRFTIHEALLGPADFEGVSPFVRLALDYEVSCVNTPPLRGSMRIMSAVPVP
jgi:hypothetical protein